MSDVPHTNEHMERAVLSAILANGQKVFAVAQQHIHTQSVFWSMKNRAVWYALCETDALGLMDEEVLDHSILIEALRQTKADKIGGSANESLREFASNDYLVRIASTGGHSAFVERDSELLATLHRKRQISRQIARASSKCGDDTEDPCEIWEALATTIDEIGTGRRGVVTASEALDANRERAEAEAAIPNLRMTWGMPVLDRMVELKLGRYDIIAARPGEGKTTLGLQLVAETAKMGTPCAFLSMEMSLEDVAEKLKVHDETAIRESSECLKLIAGRGFTPSSMASACRRLVRLGCRLVVVDYIQLAQEPGQREYEQVSAASAALRDIAVSEQVQIVGLAQLNRAFDKEKAKRAPLLSDLRGSGTIEQDGQRILFIHSRGADDAPTTDVDLLLQKNRWGAKGVIEATFDKPRGIFTTRLAMPEPREPHDKKDCEPDMSEDLFV